TARGRSTRPCRRSRSHLVELVVASHLPPALVHRRAVLVAQDAGAVADRREPLLDGQPTGRHRRKRSFARLGVHIRVDRAAHDLGDRAAAGATAGAQPPILLVAERYLHPMAHAYISIHHVIASRASMAHHIVTLPGDGIGPEIMAPTLQLLGKLGDFEFEEHVFGGASIDAHGTALTDEVLDACRGADAVLLAAVGGPKWDTTDPNAPRPEQGLLGLRKGLGLYANLRPVKPLPALYDASPLRRER